MPPRFRSDLKCSREEQQGVVFYRVDDPKTQTSFRLYEIEYLISQKLDGSRALPDVIKAVKGEYNFDISEPDLTKFVSQLDSMGFLEKEEAPQAPAEGDTKIMDRSDVAVEGDAEVIEDADLLETPSAPVDDAQLKRLLKSALMHVRQGYIVHARDYFLAAKELDPNDDRLAKLVSHLDIIGDSSGPAEVDYLWNQARELFPDIAEEVMPLADANAGPGASGEGEDFAHLGRGRNDLRTRLIWLAVLVVLVGGAAGALYYFVSINHLFEGAAKASIMTLKAQRAPVYYEGQAESVHAAREAWLQFDTSGKIADLRVTPGARVEADQVLAALALPPALDKQVEAGSAAVKKAQADYEKAALKLDKLSKEGDAAVAERDEADKKLEELKGGPKRDLDKWKKAKAKAAKKLAQFAKRERGPQQAETKAKQRLEQAQKRLTTLEGQSAGRQIRAPFAGLVVELSGQKGQAVTKDQKIVLLRDNLEARVAFIVKDPGTLAPGGEADVSVARGVPSRARVSAVQPVDPGKRVEVTLVDPTGAFIDMPPQEFRLVREFVEHAFEVPTSAVVTDNRGTHVLIEMQTRALAREVEVLSHNAASAVIRDKSGMLHDGDHLVADRLGADGGVASIVDGSFLDIQPHN